MADRVLMNAMGQVVFSERGRLTEGPNVLHAAFGAHPSGTYILQVVTDEGITTHRLVLH